MHVLTKDEVMAAVVGRSFRNFHAKGVDYVCLYRGRDLTVKAYFIDAGTDGDLVVPHDHRYDFATTVVRGSVTNIKFHRSAEIGTAKGHTFNRFAYSTALNGGNGFAWEGEETLYPSIGSRRYLAGDCYVMAHDELHTLQRLSQRTVLLHWQYRDAVALCDPTHAWTDIRTGREPPKVDGLYDRFCEDALMARLMEIETLIPGILQNYALHDLVGIPYHTVAAQPQINYGRVGNG